MKHKIKELDINNLKYNKSEINDCTLVNFTYLGSELEFQTPKVLLEKIIQENGKEYLILKVLPTEACQTFFKGLKNLEECFTTLLKINKIRSVIRDNTFLVKIPFKYSKPTIKLYSKNGSLFNYYHLKEGMEIICLLSSSKLWINFDNIVSYNLSVKEILITKPI